MFRWLAIYLCALVLCSCASPPQLPPDVDMNPDAGRDGELLVNLRLENGEEMPFVVDTGSPGTLFDKTLTSKLGWRLPIGNVNVPVGGNAQKSGVYLEPKLYLGATRLETGRLCATYDFKGDSNDLGHPSMGILAMDCLKHYCIQLDFQAGRMRFLDPKSLDVTQLGKPYPLKFWLYTPLYADHVGLAGGKTARSLVDTGWNLDGSVEKGAIPGDTNDWVHLPQCFWDGQTYTDLDVGTEGNILGLRFLARHLVTFDFPRRTMYLKLATDGRPLLDVEVKGALEFLIHLKKAGRSPGWSKEEHGTIYRWSHPDSDTCGFSARKDGDDSIYHYIVTRASKGTPWELQKAWRTDRDGKVVEEFPGQ
jgi:hypothetical protein